MIFKQIVNTIRSLPLSFRACFSSATHKNHKPSHQDPVKITKFNPLGEKDLRGFEHFDKLSEIQKEYSPIHSEEHRPYSAYGIFSLLSNGGARLIGRWVGHPKSVISSDSLYLPRIYQDSIPIYDSIGKASTYMTLNKITFKLVPFNIIFLSSEPFLSLLEYGLLGYVYYGTNWTTVKHLVVKMEYLPHTEEFAYQKVSFWGSLVTRKVRKSELQFVTLSDIFGQNSHSEKSVRGLYNRQVAYRIKGSKQLLLFDKHGIWNFQSINHEQLI